MRIEGKINYFPIKKINVKEKEFVETINRKKIILTLSVKIRNANNVRGIVPKRRG